MLSLAHKNMFDPVVRAEEIREKVTKGNLRRYYRIARGGMWYGGIATSDCCGCNLRCVFCWSNFPRDNPDRCGRFYSPEEVFNALVSCAKRKGYNQLRVSGNEVTIARGHLFELLRLVDMTNYRFIIETNGTLIDKDYAKELSRFKNIYVRVSFKGTNQEEFSRLTGADPCGFDLQLHALENLLYYRINCWPSVVISFSPPENYRNFKGLIANISSHLVDEIEKETIFLLPHIKKRLNEAGIKPLIYENIEGLKRKECIE